MCSDIDYEAERKTRDPYEDNVRESTTSRRRLENSRWIIEGKPIEDDPVNHPSHYTQGGIECIEAIEAACVGLTGDEAYYIGQVIKYIWRWKHKNGLQDLEKAEWYLSRLIGNVTAKVIADDLEARDSNS